MAKKSKQRAVRELAGKTQMVVAVQAGVSMPTLRLYEASASAVGAAKRKALDAVYAEMAAVAS